MRMIILCSVYSILQWLCYYAFACWIVYKLALFLTWILHFIVYFKSSQRLFCQEINSQKYAELYSHWKLLNTNEWFFYQCNNFFRVLISEQIGFGHLKTSTIKHSLPPLNMRSWYETAYISNLKWNDSDSWMYSPVKRKQMNVIQHCTRCSPAVSETLEFVMWFFCSMQYVWHPGFSQCNRRGKIRVIDGGTRNDVDCFK